MTDYQKDRQEACLHITQKTNQGHFLLTSLKNAACTGRNQQSVKAAGGLRPPQCSLVRMASHKFEAERHKAAKERCMKQTVSSFPIILSPTFCLLVQNAAESAQNSMPGLTLNLPKSSSARNQPSSSSSSSSSWHTHSRRG